MGSYTLCVRSCIHIYNTQGNIYIVVCVVRRLIIKLIGREMLVQYVMEGDFEGEVRRTRFVVDFGGFVSYTDICDVL